MSKPTSYADFRGSQQPGYECGGCGCRTRSHFYVCDNGDIYNVDTKGFIWYCAAASTDWAKIYKCRNFIPWQPYLSRLDHVGRDEQGRAGNFRESKRIPCGRPMAGNFCGFQTDTDACVLFKNGQKVYEGKYVSDCDGALGFGNQLGLDFYGYSTGYTYNYLTDSGCNNNEPLGNDDTLYRNTQGQYDANWNFTPNNQFVQGDVTPLFSAIREAGDTATTIAKDTLGWSISTSTTDCCGNSSITGETGFHLGTNETGTTVWFTRERIGTKWWRFAGRVASVESLPDPRSQEFLNHDSRIAKITMILDSQNHGNQGNQANHGSETPNSSLQDMDVIAITSGTDWDSLWSAPCYYLKDYTWHIAGTYQELVMQKGIAVVFHNSCQPITSCNDPPDCWIGNAQSIESSGDILLVNANRKGVDRLILSGSTVLYNAGHISPSDDIAQEDSLACVRSYYYFNATDFDSSLCLDADGIGLVTVTNEDGSQTQYIVYGSITDGWSVTETIQIPVNEEVWSGLVDAGWAVNCWNAVLGRAIDGGVERLILFKGRIIETYSYQFSWYASTTIPTLPVGVMGQCKLSYPCPSQTGEMLTSLFDGGETILSCMPITWILTGELYYITARPIETITRTTTGDTYNYDYYQCARTDKIGTNTYVSTLQWQECWDVRGRQFYRNISLGCLVTASNGNQTALYGGTLRTSPFNCTQQDYSCTATEPCLAGNSFMSLNVGNTGIFVTSTKPAFVGSIDYIKDEAPDPNTGSVSTQNVSFSNDLWHYFVKNNLSGSYEYLLLDETFSTTYCFQGQSAYSLGLDGCAVQTSDPVSLPVPNVAVFYMYSYCGNSYLGAPVTPDGTLKIKTAGNIDARPDAGCTPDFNSVSTYKTMRNIANRLQLVTAGQGTITYSNYYLGVERVVMPDPYSYNPGGCGSGYTTPSKLTTHFIEAVFEYDNATGAVCDMISINSAVEEIDVDPPFYTDTNSNYEGPCQSGCSENYPCYCPNPNLQTLLQSTLFYKACQLGLRATIVCGYLQVPQNANPNLWELQWNGRTVYSLPEDAGVSINCCEAAFAIIITETIGTTVRILYIVEGQAIWQTTYSTNTPADDRDTVQSLQCCASQSVDEDGKTLYRYALLRINALEEELVDYNGEWFGGTAAKPMTCENYPPGDSQLVIDAMAHAAEYTITLTDGTIATPTHCTADWIQEFGTGLCIPYCWYDEYTTADGVKFAGLYQKGIDPGGLDTGWRVINDPIYDNINLAKRQVSETGSGRQSILTCNGSVIGTNKNYEGIFCCGDYLLAAYVDDEYKSGWSNIVDTGGADVDIIESKHVPFPGYGDSQRPSAEDKAAWKYFNAVHSDYKVDVFYHGGKVGTYDVNDFNSPIHYDHLDMQYPWTLFAIGGGNAHSPNVGNHPDCMEGNPVCLPMSVVNQSGSVVVPFNDALTVLRGGSGMRQSFGIQC